GFNRAHSWRGQGGHLDKPLLRDQWFDRCIASLTATQRHRVLFYLDNQAELCKVFDQVSARFVAVLPGVGTRLGGHFCVKANHLDTRQIVTLTNLEVGLVVRGRYLDRACTKTGVHGLVADNWALAPNQWQ